MGNFHSHRRLIGSQSQCGKCRPWDTQLWYSLHDQGSQFYLRVHNNYGYYFTTSSSKTSNSIKLVSTSPSSTLGNVPNWEMASHGEVRWELHTPYGSREGLTEDRSCGCKGLLKLKLWNLGAYLIKKKTGVLTSTTMVTVILLYQIGPVVAAPRRCKILYTRTNTFTFSYSTSSEATGLAWTPGTPRCVDGFHLKTEKPSSQLIFLILIDICNSEEIFGTIISGLTHLSGLI